MANALNLSVDPLYGSRELELNAAFILRSGELQAAKTLALYTTIGQGLQAIGQTVGQMYESRNRTAVEMWKLGESQRQFDQEFMLKRETARLDGELKKVEIEKIRVDQVIAQQNAEIQRAQLAGDRSLMPLGAQVTADYQTDVARGMLGEKALEAASRTTMKSKIDGSDIPVVSDKFLTFKARDLTQAKTRILSDDYNGKGMTAAEAMGAISSPNNPDRMEALRLINSHSDPDSFRQLAANVGVVPGTADWTRLQEHIRNPSPVLRDRSIQKLQIAVDQATGEEKKKLSLDLADMKAGIARDWTDASKLDRYSERNSFYEAMATNGESMEDQMSKIDEGWFGAAMRVTGKNLKTSGRFLAGTPNDDEAAARWIAMGKSSIQQYLDNGDPDAKTRMDYAITKLNEISHKHGGPVLTYNFFAPDFVHGYNPGGYPKLPEDLASPMAQDRFIDLFRNYTALMPSVTSSTPVQQGQIGLAPESPFASSSDLVNARLPSGTKAWYTSPEGVRPYVVP